jgi:uncharacterized protein YndB with AHSA1/START domain
MARATVTVMVDRPVAEVWTYITDPDRAPEWQASAIEVKRESPGPIAVGSRWTEVRKFLGKRIDQTMEVTELEPERAFSLKARSGPVPIEVRHTFSAADGRTRIQVDFKGEPGGFFKLAEPLVVRTAQRQFQGDLDTLKDLLESGAR